MQANNADCSSLSQLSFSFTALPHSRSVFLRINCGLALELDLLRSTRGSVQRVTPCCHAPTTTMKPRYYDPDRDKLPQVCSACDGAAAFTTQAYPIFCSEMKSSTVLTQALAAWLGELGYACLEDDVAACLLQDVCEQAFKLVNESNNCNSNFQWHPRLLAKFFEFVSI